MLRRGSGWGVVAIVIAVTIVFTPFAAASNAGRPAQTLTVLAFVCALVGLVLTWLVMRQRGYVRMLFLVLGTVVGGLATVWLLAVVKDFRDAPREGLLSRLLILAVANTVGMTLIAWTLRRVYPRRRRGLAAAAIVLVSLALLPGPTLLIQPGVSALNILDQKEQLHAGFLYWTTGAALLVAPFLALMTLPGDWFEAWWQPTAEWAMAISSRVFVGAVLVLVLGLSAYFAVYSFDARPTTADEIAQLWHARILTSGRLALPPDPNPEFFAIDNVIDRPLWMSQFPIGGPATLMLGLLVGAVWLLNPILTALTTFNVYRFAQRAYGEAQARAAIVVFALSPMVLIMGATHMNHMPTAWLVTLALATLPVWLSASDSRRLDRAAALIGVAIGAAIAIRPLDGVVAGAIIGVVMLFNARGRTRARSLVVALAAGAIPVMLLLVANWRTTGNPLRFGYEVLWGPNHSLGLHDDPTGHPHTAWRALLLGIKYAEQLNWIVTNWPVPIVIVVAAGLLLGRRRHPWDVLLLTMLGAQLVVYALYWHDGQFVGPRFLFTAVPALIVLAARAPFVAAERLTGVWWRIAVILVPVCIGVAWLRRMPPFGVQALAREFRESRSRLKLDPPREVQTGLLSDALVFVQEGAATRLLHRMWGVGISRANAARLLASADACSLLEVVRGEERQPSTDSLAQIQRIEASVRPFRRTARTLRVPDPAFQISDTTSLTPACIDEIARDNRLRNTVAYGPMLLLNRFDDAGRVAGPVIYVMNLGEHNQVLRSRFGSRRWYRYEVPRSQQDTLPILVPYDSLP